MTAKQQDGDAIAAELRRLVSFKPLTSDQTATKRVLSYFREELRAIGLQVSLGSNKGYSYLIGGTKSTARSHILLQAHVDVVPAPAKLFDVTVTEDRLYGRGVYDMLFGAAVFLAVLRKLHKQGQLSDLDIGIMLTTDEEIGGFYAAQHAIGQYDCSVCVLPDAGGEGALSIRAKGVLQLEVTVGGRSGHAGRPKEYDNPLYRLGLLITALQRKFPNSDPNATVCSLTTTHAGGALNQVPDSAILTLDIRYAAEDKPQELAAAVAAIASLHSAHVRELVCEPAFHTDPANPLIRAYTRMYEKMTGTPASFMAAPGSSDARFFTLRGIPVIMTRPAGGGLHGPDEWISRSSLQTFADVLLAYLKQHGAGTLPNMSTRPYNETQDE